MANFIDRLASRMVKLERRVDGLATGPQLAHSSIEDGSLEEYDSNGQLVSIIGRQPDGTHGAVVVSGPVPPRPSAPAVSGGPGLLNYGWDGNFADEASGETDITIPAPMDFGRAEAHASKLQGFSADTAATLLDTFESPRGGSRTVMLEPGTWFVKLVTRALSGKRSAESLEVSIEVQPPMGSDVDVDALREEFHSADAALNEALQANTTAQAELAGTVADLRDTELPALETSLADAQTRLDGAETLLTDTFPSRFTAVESAAATAKATADGAQSAASAAQTAAQSAQTKADTAFTNAATAQSRADTAFTNAATAAGIANGKGKVLVQNTAPGSDDRNAQTLWIDTTSGANTPKRWVSGTTWAAVTDKAATDAAAAAASAASAAATAKSAADAAQATANAAQTAAGTAQSTANNALTMAGSKSKVYYDTAVATGTATNGDTWRRVDGSGNVIAEWRYSNGWVTQRITSDVISNLDVGKLTAGTANIVSAVAEKIAAATATFQKADIGNLTVTGDSQLNTVTAQRIAASVASFLSLTTDQLTAGTAQINTAVMNKVFAEMFATRKLFANQVVIGEPGNMFPDPNFQDPAGWQISGNYYAVLAAGGRNGNAALEVPASTSQVGRYYGSADRNRQFRVTGGSTYQARVWFKSDMAITAANRVAIYGKWSNPSTAVAGSAPTPSIAQNSAAVAANTWTELVYEFTVPEQATHAHIGLYVQAAHNSRVLFSEPSVREMITPVLAVQGLIDGQTIRGVDLMGGTITQEANGFRTRMYTHPVRGGVVEFSSGDTSDPGYLSMNNLGGMDIKLPKSSSADGLLLFKAGNDAEGIFNPMSFDAHRGAGRSGLSVDGTVSTKRLLWVGSPVQGDANNLSLVVRDTASTSAEERVYNQLAISGKGMVRTTADLTITAPDGVQITSTAGPVVVGGTTMEDTNWASATYQNGWMDYGNGFGGLQYRRKNGVLYIRGSIKGGANVTTVANLPPNFRPVVPEGTTAMEFPIAVSQGGTWSSGVMYAYSNGNLTYSANGATWTGFNRAVINAAFPL